MDHLLLEEISKYLTEAVLYKAFKLKTGSQENIKDINIKRAAPAGSGLLGAVFRIKVKTENHTATFVVKGMVQDPLLRKSLQTAVYFEREALFFSEILPMLVDVQKSSGAKERLSNHVPICYAYHCDGENDFLLMEDLCDSNYSAVSDNLSKIERDAILKTLAHLHAVSIVLRIRRPDEFDKITDKVPELYYSETRRAWYQAYLQDAIKVDLQALAEYEDPESSIYYKRFFELVNNDPYGQMIKLVSDRSAHSSINHGDAWAPNFFCSNTKAVAIDFQILRRASPVLDLSFFLILSSKQSLNKNYTLEGIKLYHEALSYYLKDMGVDAANVFSWEDLIEELKNYGRFGVLSAVSTIPLLCSERCDVFEDFERKYKEVDRIPLEELWVLKPFQNEDDKLFLVNAVRVAVDIGFI